MKVKDLVNQLLQRDQEAEVLQGVWNGETETYGVVDYILEDYFENSVYNDLYGTPGRIDERLLSKELNNKDAKIVYIGSHFPIKYSFNIEKK